MRYLYVLLLLSLAALLWAAWAISRHIRKHSGEPGEDHQDLIPYREDGRGVEIAAQPLPIRDQLQTGKPFEK